jgi:hypothetical protein
MDKAARLAQTVPRLIPNVENLLVEAEHELGEAIKHHALRPRITRRAEMVRRMQLMLVRFRLLAAPNDRQLAEIKAMWEAMSIDDIVGAYRARA